MKIHLDTDIGGDLDDLCALAMILRWPGLEITGVTTVTEEYGRRAGYARYVLDLAGRNDVPVAAGADASEGYFRYPRFEYPPEAENWPEPVAPQPGSTSEALALLKDSIEQGAIIAAIGPYTNLRLLDQQHPGILRRAEIVVMGGSVYPAPEGYPRWPNDDDYNIQTDAASAQHVLTQANPTIVPLGASAQTALRRAYLPDLVKAGPLGQLIARQAEVFARMEGHEQTYGGIYPGLPRDIINFQHDPLACAVALGWREGVTIETVRLKIEMAGGWLSETPDPDGLPRRVVTGVDGDTVNEFWRDVICGGEMAQPRPLSTPD